MSFKLQQLFAALMVAFCFNSNAQAPEKQGRGCSTPVPPAAWDAWFNSKINEVSEAHASAKMQSTYVIPVIVHVIHGGQAVGTYPNISKAQLNSQLSILNADFAGSGFGVGNAPPPFAPLVADCDITFLPAELDPNGVGLVEPGIHRIDWQSICASCDPLGPNNSPAFQAFFDSNIKPATIWDPTKYMNIWVSDVKSNVDILGYATFPIGTSLTGIFNGNGTTSTDGIWVKSNAYGNTGSLDPTYNKGRTATHELGHWLGLRHIWGDGSCGDDFCNDTPPQANYNTGCPGYPKVSCSNSAAGGEMFMNFMDYCDDPCLYMFTGNQRTRMHTAMTFGTYRKDLTASSATLCNLPKQAPVAAFNLANNGCMDSTIIVTNQSAGLPAPVYLWSASPQSGVTFLPDANAENPTIVFSQSGSYMVSVTAMNSSGDNTGTLAIEVSNCDINAGIEAHNIIQKGFSIFPNPAGTEVNITLDLKGNSGAVLRLQNSLGQVIAEKTLTNGENVAKLDVASYDAGIYTVSVQCGKQRSVGKLVVSR
jgi:hypothetical protein